MLFLLALRLSSIFHLRALKLRFSQKEEKQARNASPPESTESDDSFPLQRFFERKGHFFPLAIKQEWLPLWVVF